MAFPAIFVISAVLACIAAIALLNGMMPPGEGSFGVAKLAPLILIVLIPVCFCLIWFPANVLLWLFTKREQRKSSVQAKPILLLSGSFFVLTLGLSGYFLGPQLFHRVHFRYKLEDQFGQPISGATIRRHNDFATGARDSELQSDAEGLFQETCKPGESFTLNPRKEGYALSSLNASGAYSEELRQKQKSASGGHDTIVIKMWKAQGAEPLIGVGKKYKLHWTNTPIYFDLLSGTTVASGGDIRISVNRPPGIISGRNPQAWSVKFEAVDGGLMDSSGTEGNGA